jgi:hypothetical protein
MFGKCLLNTCLAALVLLMAGCGVFSGAKDGLAPTELLVLDSDFELSATIAKGDVLGLDMPIPVKSGHEIVGASFDPAVLRLEQYIEYIEDGRRARYLFTARESGTVDILIKMEPAGGGPVEIYKRVTVNVSS